MAADKPRPLLQPSLLIRTMSSLTNSYELTNLDAESQYSVWVNVDTVDYGQSELNDEAIFSTIASSASELNLFETLEALYVRLVLGLFKGPHFLC